MLCFFVKSLLLFEEFKSEPDAESFIIFCDFDFCEQFTIKIKKQI